MRPALMGVGLALWLPLVAMAQLAATTPADAASSDVEREEELEQAEFSDLRERLTEREDENRVSEPWTTELFGHPLTVAGELESAIFFIDQRSIGEPDEEYDRLLLEEGLEVEAFYSMGTELSIFLQARAALEWDLHDQTPDQVSDLYFERGEMWIYSEEILGTPFSVEVGSLDFEDDRLWWWDEDLDAVRLGYETDDFEVLVAVAQELTPRRSDRAYIDPELKGVLRLISEVSWDWQEHHAVQFFALHQRDHSDKDRLGSVVRQSREDESDARLTWLGLRAIGAWDFEENGIFGYWLDTAIVWGHERFIAFEDVDSKFTLADDVIHRDVRGWAIDTGVNWLLDCRFEPRIFAGYAFGSGDENPETGTDHAFRQTGIHANEAGFGGVERYGHYGNLLDPELSNLHVFTLGTGITLLENSSLDLVYHYYRMVEPAEELRDARFEPEFNASGRDVGHGVDLVLAIEEWERVEIEFDMSAFKAGRAFAADRDEWTWGGFFSFRVAF